MTHRTHHPLLTALLGLAAIASAAQAKTQAGADGFSPDMKLRYAERIVESYYVDSVASDHLVEEAIKAMLKTLDPHSVYTDAEETRELTTPLEGNFSGIGIQFNMLEDTVFVVQTIPGGPCEKVGIMPGDRIVQAGDSVLAGRKLPNSRIMNVLRGPKGSEVDLKVVRRSEPDTLLFSLVRDDIPIYSVDAAYMADPTTGYIRITRFGETTDKEVDEAMARLKKEGMKNLIIDLSDNGGGYLGAATAIAGRFLDKGDPIVYTESPKFGTSTYDNESRGNFRDGRVVVIVNQFSASASEILSGALQDNDRGVIIGRRTFGKGLVQRPFPFPDGSMIRLTVSRYHTPSGRCIQRPYDTDDPEKYEADLINRYNSGELVNADSIRFDESQRYTTLRNGRTVYGGGGIMPDLFVPIDTTGVTPFYRNLIAKGLLNRFAIRYVDDNRRELRSRYPDEAAFVSDFAITPDIIDSLTALAEKEGVESTPEQLEESLPYLRVVLKGLMGSDLYGSATYYKIVYPEYNNDYRRALELINDPEAYETLLAPPSTPKKR